jgi:hypothetical protein
MDYGFRVMDWIQGYRLDLGLWIGFRVMDWI